MLARTPSHRIVDSIFAATPCKKPDCIPTQHPTRTRGARRLGHKYEEAFAKALEAKFPSCVLSGQWFQFNDRNGKGHCQTDVILRAARTNIIFECKLTDVDAARSQLSHLYFPVVERALGKPVLGIVVTRHLSKETQTALVVDNLHDAVLLAKAGKLPTLHWRERAPL